MLRPVAALALALPIVLLLACDSGSDADPTDPVEPTPPGSGRVVVQLNPSGGAPQATYRIVVDGVATSRSITSGPAVTLSLPAGRHEVRLDSLPAYCTAAGNPRTVDVAIGASASLVFTVSCSGATVRLQTTGLVPDKDGYHLVVDGETIGAPLILPNGDALVGIPAGARRLSLSGVASNCTVADSPRTVQISATGQNPVAFVVTCIAAVLRVEVATTGPDRDADGFTVTAAGDPADTTFSARLASTDARPIGAWLDGTRVTASLGGVASNCTPDATSRSVTVRSPDTLTVRFTLACVALPPGGLLLTLRTGPQRTLETFRLPGGSTEFLSQGEAYAAEWAPGGGAFAFGAGVSLRLIETGDASVRELATGTNPAFSPDGRRLFFIQHASCPWGCIYPSVIQELDLLDAAPQPRVAFSGKRIVSFDLSPDGMHVAYVRESTADYYVYELVVADMDGTGERVLLEEPFGLEAMRPRFSPDGREVLVNKQCLIGNGMCGYAVPVDGSAVRGLGGGTALAWSPDGSRVLLADGRGQLVTVLALDGTAPQFVATPPLGTAVSASWRR